MRPSRHHNAVEITVFLKNGCKYTYAWTTGLPQQRAAGRALGWAKRKMREDHITGRSQITGYDLSTWQEPGVFIKGLHGG